MIHIMEFQYEPILDDALFEDVCKDVISDNATSEILNITPEQAEVVLALCLLNIWDRMYEKSIPCAMPCNLNIEQFTRKLIELDDTIKAEYIDEECYLTMKNHRWRIRQNVMTGELFVYYGIGCDNGMKVKDRGEEVLKVLDETLPMVKEELQQYIQQ